LYIKRYGYEIIASEEEYRSRDDLELCASCKEQLHQTPTVATGFGRNGEIELRLVNCELVLVDRGEIVREQGSLLFRNRAFIGLKDYATDVLELSD
jgi:hypothetical protein